MSDRVDPSSVAAFKSKKFLSVKEAAAVSSYTTAHVTRLAQKGSVIAERDGRQWIIDSSSLQDFVWDTEEKKKVRKEQLRKERMEELHSSNAGQSLEDSDETFFILDFRTGIASVAFTACVALLFSLAGVYSQDESVVAGSTVVAGVERLSDDFKDRVFPRTRDLSATTLLSAPIATYSGKVLGWLWCDIKLLWYKNDSCGAPAIEYALVPTVNTVNNRDSDEETSVTVNNTYITNPVEREVVEREIIREVFLQGEQLSFASFITRTEYENQVDGIMRSIENIDTSGGGSSGLTDITGESIEDLSDVAAMTEATGDLLSWNGSGWTNVATSSLGISGGGAVDSVNGQIGVVVLDTGDISENGNLYFTNARARETLSSSATGLSYATSTGVFSLTAGYTIPLSASTTEWDTVYSWGDHSLQNYIQQNDNVVFGNATTTNLVVTNNITTSLNAGCVEVAGGILTSTGSNCGTGSGGITNLNGLTASSQSFATSTSGGLDLNITSSGGVHTFAAGLSAGYTIPLSASTTEWDTAYSWGDHSLVGYLTEVATTTVRGMLGAGTGLSYNSGTGEFTNTGVLSIGGLTGAVSTSSLHVATSTYSFTSGTSSVALSLDGFNSNDYLTLAAWNATTTDALDEGLTNQYFTTARARESLSSSVTGLSYATSTGVFSLTAGYTIPLSASTTAWNNFYNTPSTRITAGTNIDWTGNTLNVDTDLANYSNTNTAFIDLTDISSTATGLSYNNTNGVFSLTSGYQIPLTASTTAWNNTTNLVNASSSDWTTAFNTINASSTFWDTAFSWGDHGVAGYLVAANNLSDLTSSSTARTNLGLGALATLNNLSTFTTTDLSEGSNLYFTNLRADARIAAGTTTIRNMLTGVSPIGYNAGTGEISFTNPGYITGIAWGAITGTLSDQIDLQLALDSKLSTTTAASTYYLASNPAGYTTNTGTVTSVGLTLPTGLSVTGSPITTSGTLAVTLTSGYTIPLSASTTEWSTAYSWGDHAAQGYLTTITGQSIENLSDVSSMTKTTGDLLSWNGASWTNVATSSLGFIATESDPIFTASTAFGIDNTDVTNWNAAYASTTALTPAYLRGLFSNSATGLTYNSSTGATSLTAGYNIPLTASTTAWNNTTNLVNASSSSWTTAFDIVNASSTFWDTAFSWGDHGVAGYLVAANNLSDLTSSSTARTNLGVDAAGADNSTNVTLAGENYLSLIGQEITANAINPDNLAATDFGDFTCNGTTCSFDTSTVSDNEIDYTTVTLNDFTFDVGNVSKTEFGYLDGVTSAIQTQLDSKLSTTTAASTYLTITTASSTYLHSLNNLGDLTNTTTARTNLGLGSIALLNSIDISANTNLGVTATGLELSGDNIALTSGYTIPLSASTTEWASFFTTPSTRITAGTNIDWTGNTLNVDTDLANYSNTNTAFIDLTNLSSLVTGLSYNNTNGQFSLTAGYTIPLSASTTEWANKVSSQWTTNGSDIYYNTGNVGIGTTTPDTKLAIHSNTDSIITLSSNNDGNIKGIYFNSDTGIIGGTNRIWAFDSEPILVGTNDTERLRITGAGNVGIGSTSPSSKLTVQGDAWIGGNLTATGTLAITGATTLSSTLGVTGHATLATASSTNITVSGNSYIGTVLSGAWQGSDIDISDYTNLGVTATGLSLSGDSIALTAGYIIPLSASTTAWNNTTNTVTAGATNWNTAYSWGDHSLSNYITNITGESFYDLADTPASSNANRLLYQSASNVVDSANLTFNGSLFNVIGTASSTSLSTGNASTTNFTVSTNSYLGTVRSGTWNGTAIDISDYTNLGVTATGLTLSGDDIALTAGYTIPLTASTTEWTNFYNTPSNRITAGTGLSWSGNTLNASSSADINYWTKSGSNVYRTIGNVGIGTSTPNSALTVVGNTYLSGNLTASGTLAVTGTATSTFASGMEVTGDIIPSANDVYSLGSLSRVWRDLYIGPGSLYVNGKKVIQDISDTITISTDADQNLMSQTSGVGVITMRALGSGNANVNTGSGNINITSTSGNVNIGTTGSGQLNLGTVTTGVWQGTDIDISDYTNLSVTATGLELSGDAVALTSGYNIPLTASTTAWNNFYNTPSTRITAGTNIDWTGNTLNVDTDLANYSNTNTAFIDLTDISSTATGLSYNNTNGVFSLTSGYQIPLTASTTAWNNTTNTVTAGATNWNTAFGWGDHSLANYITNITGESFYDLADTQSSYTANRVLYQSGGGVADSANLTFNGSLFNVIGTASSTNLFTTNATTTNLTTSGHATLATASSTNLSISGNSYLGTVLSGAWQGTAIDISSYTNLGVTATGLELSGDNIALTAGYTIPLTASTTAWNNTANTVTAGSASWDAAAASTTALTPAYMRGLFSNSATGLTYNSSTGATSLTAGYNIPLTASTTAWENKVSSQWTTSGSDIYYTTGNIGIGTSTPSSRLTVQGVGGTDNIFTLASSTGASLLTFTSTGRLGIGTTTPGYALTVAGDINLTGALRTNGDAGTNGYILQSTGSGAPQWVATSTLGFAASGGTTGSSSVAFLVHKNGTDQTVTVSTETLLTWTTEVFDTNNNFDLSTERFTPTVEGKYIFTGSVYCPNSTTHCSSNIYKNGSRVTSAIVGGGSSGGNQGAVTTIILDMNGTTDYVDLRAFNYGGTTVSGDIGRTNFSGALIAPSNGLAGGWSNDETQSYLADYTDLVAIGTTTAAAKLDVWGTGSSDIFAVSSSTGSRLLTVSSAGNLGLSASSYLNWGTTLGTSGYGIRDNAGTLEYKNSGGAWAGIGTGSGGTTGSSSVAFSVHKNGTNQTVTANVSTLLTWSAEVFDTNNNFASNRFTPTVAGKYMISANTLCIGGNTYCDVFVYKNGSVINGSQGSSGTSFNGGATISTLIDMNGTTDYIEMYVKTSGTTVEGDTSYTGFSGALIAPSNGLAGGWSNDETQSYLADYTDLVAIGTTTAAAKLDVWGSAGSTDILGISSSTGSRLLTLTSAGNLGLGTTTPQAKLTVVGTSGTQNIFTLASSTGASLLTFTSTGRLGIGTTTPTHALSVVGDIFATGSIRDSLGNAGSAGYVLQSTGTGTTWVATSTLGFAAADGGSGGMGNPAFIFASSTAGSNIAVNFTGLPGESPVFTAGTLELPSDTTAVVVEVWGAGGGGGGGGNLGQSGAGGTSCFGTNATACTTPMLQATGGGVAGSSGQGGVGGLGSGGDVNLTGGAGGSTSATNATLNYSGGGSGGSSPRGGGGGTGSRYNGTPASQAGAAFGGGGGGGGLNGANTSDFAGNGGGAGGYSQEIVRSPSGTYYYTIGSGGAGAAAGTAGYAGAAGGAGGITITVYTSSQSTGGTGGVASSSVAFLVNKGGANQTVTTNTWTKLTWSTEQFDTNNNFASDRFTPTVAGKYIVSATVFCQDSNAYCQSAVYKNGSEYTREGSHASVAHGASVSAVVDMNGTSDYLEVYVYNGGGTTISGGATFSNFSGALIAPSNGLAGGWSNDETQSYLADYTDLVAIGTTTAAAKLDVWGSAGSTDILGISSSTGTRLLTLTSAGNLGLGTSTPSAKLSIQGTGNLLSLFDTAGNSIFSIGSATTSTSTLATNLAITGNLSLSGSLYDSTSSAGTSGMVLQSTGSGTTWVATSTLGFAASGGTTGSSSVAFSVHKGGTNQTVTSGATALLTWSAEVFDTNNNFVSNRFTPTVAGKYVITLSSYASNAVSYVAPYIYKNGSPYALDSSQGGVGKAVAIIDMNGTTDYIEAYVNTDGTIISGDRGYTNFTGALIAPSNGLAGGWSNDTTQSYLADYTDLVAIGTTTAAAKLDVWGSAGSTDILGISSSTGTRLLTVTAGGNVGIGTTSLQNKLHVYTTTVAGGITVDGTSNPSLSLTSNGVVRGYISSITTAGNIITGSAVNDIALRTQGGKMLFSTNSGTRAHMTINSSGNVIIGGSSFVAGNENIEFNAAGYINTSRSTTAAAGQLQFFNPNGVVGTVTTSGSATSYNTTSDRRVKDNIDYTKLGLDDLMQLPVRDFSFITDENGEITTGFIAQELYEIFPWAVTVNGDNGIDPLTGSSTPWSVDYGRLTPLLAKSIQDLNLKLEDLATTTPISSLLLATSTSTSTSSVIETFTVRFFKKVIEWFADSTNGIGNFFANRVSTKELCVGDESGGETCITKSQLDALLQSATAGSSVGSTGGGGGGSAPSPEPPVDTNGNGGDTDYTATSTDDGTDTATSTDDGTSDTTTITDETTDTTPSGDETVTDSKPTPEPEPTPEEGSEPTPEPEPEPEPVAEDPTPTP